jgi:hypothetical protein
MLALSRTERHAVSAAALAAFLTAFAIVPGQAVSRFASAGQPPVPRRAMPAPTDVLPEHDPFVPLIADASPAPPAAAAPRLVPLPPNARAGAFPFAGTMPPPLRLLAVVSGPQPGAIVDEGGASRFVVRGDRVAGARIRAIDPDGIRLDDGRRISLARTDPEESR